MTDPDAFPACFRLAFVPGATPAKWVRVWNERKPDIPLTLYGVSAAEAYDVLRGGGADAGLVRLPVDRTVFSAIPLYTETTVVIVPRDHLVTAADEVTTQDLADEVVWHPLDDVLEWERRPGQAADERPATTEDAVALVAAGVGVLVVPQSLARLHHRRDLTYRPVTDAPVSRVALAWPEERTTDLVDDFIGDRPGAHRQQHPRSPCRRRAGHEARPPRAGTRREERRAASHHRTEPARRRLTRRPPASPVLIALIAPHRPSPGERRCGGPPGRGLRRG